MSTSKTPNKSDYPSWLDERDTSSYMDGVKIAYAKYLTKRHMTPETAAAQSYNIQDIWECLLEVDSRWHDVP